MIDLSPHRDSHDILPYAYAVHEHGRRGVGR